VLRKHAAREPRRAGHGVAQGEYVRRLGRLVNGYGEGRKARAHLLGPSCCSASTDRPCCSSRRSTSSNTSGAGAPAAKTARVIRAWCTTVEGYALVDLVIDLDKKVVKRSAQDYTISNVTEQYITGIDSYNNNLPPVGGEIMVLNRFTGDFKRAWVGMFCKEPSCEGGATVLRMDTQSGKCFGAMF